MRKDDAHRRTPGTPGWDNFQTFCGPFSAPPTGTPELGLPHHAALGLLPTREAWAHNSGASADMLKPSLLAETGKQPTTTAELSDINGSTYMEVQGEDISPEEYAQVAGWTHVGPRRGPANRNGTKTPPLRIPAKTFARKAAAAAAKAARMPNILPREETKIVIRPRGGLNIARTPLPVIQAALLHATRLGSADTVRDTFCPNLTQNILIISTPDELRATRYATVQKITVYKQEHEIAAYQTAPEWTVKGVISGVPSEYTQEEIYQSIVTPRNSTARGASRIGESQAVVIIFEGHEVPRTIYYGSMVMRCKLYRKSFDVCRRCRTVGHRSDVCNNPQDNLCFACGEIRRGEEHEATCKPKCLLCQEDHPTGDYKCKNRYKTPYIVKKRQWERKREDQKQAQRQQQNLTPNNFPDINPRRPQGRQRSQSRGRNPSRGRSKSRDTISWATIATKRLKETNEDKAHPRDTQANGKEPSTSHGDRRDDAEIRALREENQRYRQECQELHDQLARMAADLKALERQVQLQAATNTPKSPPTQKEETGTEPLPGRKPMGPAPKRKAVEVPTEGKEKDGIEERMDRVEGQFHKMWALLTHIAGKIGQPITEGTANQSNTNPQQQWTEMQEDL